MNTESTYRPRVAQAQYLGYGDVVNGHANISCVEYNFDDTTVTVHWMDANNGTPGFWILTDSQPVTVTGEWI
jgi:hypothetical protein